jgi:hypothetical protein
MKIKILAVLLLTVGSALAQQSINFGSQIPSVGTYSTGANWETSGTFKFEVGTFASGFIATNSNTNSWAANWIIANQGGTTGVAQWINDGGDIGFIGSARITTLSAPFTGGASLYMWGYNSKAAGNQQWILLSNTAWVVSSDISNPVSSDLTVNATTTSVIGNISGSGTTFQSALVSVSAIPEPSTFAALFGAAALGMAACRRRRTAA